MGIMLTFKTEESFSMNIKHPKLLLPSPETTYKIIMQIMMINFTLTTLTTCSKIDNL